MFKFLCFATYSSYSYPAILPSDKKNNNFIQLIIKINRKKPLICEMHKQFHFCSNLQKQKHSEWNNRWH